MKQLTLSIKQKFFDEIVAGVKKQEFREIRPTNSSKYILYIDESGNEYKDYSVVPEEIELDIKPIAYDTIKFLTGEHKGKRPYAIVEVKGAMIELFEDEKGNLIKYEYKGKSYIEAQIVYDLGEVIEKP